MKVSGTKGLIIRNVTNGVDRRAAETNGGYGLYPVLCTDVLIEDCTVRGASDAGIYVGQSENVIVRRNKVEKNVAGIEIENCTKADVYENMATDNSGGILVFTMPDLPKKDGRHCRVYQNTVLANNHENFAPKGNIVATVPPGTGVMIMASDEVEVFDNSIENNQTAGLSIVSYLIADKPIKDEKYDPFCESIHIHDNRFKTNGEKPSGAIGTMVSKVVGSPLPGHPLRWHGQSEEALRRLRCRRSWQSTSTTTATPTSPISTSLRIGTAPAARHRRSSATSSSMAGNCRHWNRSRSRE